MRRWFTRSTLETPRHPQAMETHGHFPIQGGHPLRHKGWLREPSGSKPHGLGLFVSGGIRRAGRGPTYPLARQTSPPPWREPMGEPELLRHAVALRIERAWAEREAAFVVQLSTLARDLG